MPTLQDVASKAGVSTATVSKVLSNTPYVSEATRDKVLRAVRKLGYRPNLAARALSTGKTQIIGIVFPHVYQRVFQDPLVMQLLGGVEEICVAQGYNLLLNTPRLQDDNRIDDNYRQLLDSRYVDGIIALDNVKSISYAAEAAASGIPAVAIGHHDVPYTIYSDDYSGGRTLMAHVLAHGHRQIGIIHTPPDVNISVQKRLAGMQAALEAAGYDFERLPQVKGDFSIASGSRAVDGLLAQAPELTAIVSINDRMAIGAVYALQARGLRVPDDISVVGYDNLASTATMNPPLTTIDQQATRLGAQAATMLLQLLDDQLPEESNVVVSPLLIERGSLLAINDSTDSTQVWRGAERD